MSGTSPPPNRREAVAAALARLAPRACRTSRPRPPSTARWRARACAGRLPETAARLALVAYARHVFTDYDDLLADGYDRDSARHFVLDDLNAVLAAWGAAPIPEADADPEEVRPRPASRRTDPR